MSLRTVALTIVVITLTGCAVPQVSMTKQIQSKIDRAEGILTIPQNNLDVKVEATYTGDTGLLGALIGASIDSSRQSNAEKEAAPMIESLRDYDFRTVMLGASTEALTNIDQVKFVMPLRVDAVASDSAKRIAFDQSTSSAILFNNVSYQLKSGNLIVTAKAEMYPKADTLKQFRNKPSETNPLDRGNVIYRKIFTFTKQAVTQTTIKDSLTEAATSIASQLAADLNHGL